MPDPTATIAPEIAQAFLEYDQKATFKNLKVACILGMLLMPAGVVLDYFVYPNELFRFLLLRLACSGLIGLFLGIVLTPFGHRHYRVLGVTLAMFPTFFMSCMVYLTDGASSPYYAGLNLVLLMIGFVCNWAFIESFSAVLLVLIMYISTCLLYGPINTPEIKPAFLNNIYFLVTTGVIVVTGNHFHTKLRLREFALRFALDRSRRELEENHQRLLELDQIKSRFFANVSHELRTPLTLLLAPLETLLHRFTAALDDETKNLLLTMHSNGMRLLKLINDLLDLVRLESGRMEVRREPLSIPEFVRGLLSAVRQMAQDKRIRLETVVDPELGVVSVDRDKLEKILLNLLFNALKFTPAGGSITLRAFHEGEHLVLLVKDTGMGISEKNLLHVFDRFWQADDSSRRKYQGMGIGLALVKELVEVQGGHATVTSQEGKGATFSIRLPYLQPQPGATPSDLPPGAFTPAAASAGQTAAATEEWLANLYRRAELFPAMTPLRETVRPIETTHNGTQPKILIADDEPDMLRFLRAQLQAHYYVLEAVDGQQAIDKAAQFLPDIILLDMMMPEKDGLQACRELRERTPTQAIPVILITARADEETKLAALAAGASDFLPKPFSTTELHVRVKNLVDSCQLQRKLARQNQVLGETIEQLKDTETQLVQTEKLASLGRMSAGIIHEINNPLNFATTGLYTLKNKAKYLPPNQQQEYSEILKDIEEGLQRVQTIVTDLRSFSHLENEIIEQVDIPQVVTAALRFLSHEWRDHVQIHQWLPENQTVWANKNRMIQVMVNLLQNALDALKSKTFTPNESPTIWIEARTDHDRSLVVVRDNGPGIQPEHLDKIFDPFFTTKEVGQGTGLGLSIVYRIIQESDARIAVRSEPGQFCEFTMEFPVKGRPALAPQPQPQEERYGNVV